jgi:hypothetical protein
MTQTTHPAVQPEGETRLLRFEFLHRPFLREVDQSQQLLMLLLTLKAIPAGSSSP